MFNQDIAKPAKERILVHLIENFGMNTSQCLYLWNE